MLKGWGGGGGRGYSAARSNHFPVLYTIWTEIFRRSLTVRPFLGVRPPPPLLCHELIPCTHDCHWLSKSQGQPTHIFPCQPHCINSCSLFSLINNDLSRRFYYVIITIIYLYSSRRVGASGSYLNRAVIFSSHAQHLKTFALVASVKA